MIAPSLRTLCTTLVLLGAPAALAAEPVEVAVVGVHVDGLDDEAAADAAARVAAALEDAGQLRAVPPGEVRKRIAGRESLVVESAFQGAGRRALDEGRVLYERAEFDDAMASLEQAVTLLVEGLPGATDNRLLIDALLLQGLTHFSVGDNGPAREAFRRVVTLDPTRRLDAVNYSQPTVDLFDQVRAEVMALGVGAVEVQAQAGSEVFVDGRSRGRTPLRVDALPPGTHWVRVVGPGGEQAFDEVEILADKKLKLDVDLARGLLAAAATDADERARQTGQLYGALGDYANTPLLLLAGEVGGDGIAVQLYEPSTGNFSRSFEASGKNRVADIADAVVGLSGFLDESGRLRSDAVQARAVPLDISDNAVLLSMLLDPEPIVVTVEVPGPGAGNDDRRKVPWYVWAGVGAVAAGGAATTAVLVATNTGDGGGGGTGDYGGTITVGPMP